MVRITQIRTPEQLADAFFAKVDDRQLECMTQRHQWPVINLRNRALPKGISATRQHDGCYQIRETCPNCGKVRWYTTLPGGVFDVQVHYRYEDPQNWTTKHDDIELTRRDYKAELFRRAAEQLTGIVASAAEPPEQPARATVTPRFTAPAS